MLTYTQNLLRITGMLLLAFSLVLAVPALSAQASDQLSVLINGRPLTTDVQPVLINDRTMVPLRSIFEAFDAVVEWDEESQTITATRGNTLIILQVGSSQATVNGTPVTLDSPPATHNGRTLVPARFAAESLQAHVNYDEQGQVVRIVGRIRHEIDIFTSSPSETCTFDHGVYSGPVDDTCLPSGRGLWLDRQGNLYSGTFSVTGNDLSIDNGEILYDGYIGQPYASPLSGPPWPLTPPGPVSPGGWKFAGGFWSPLYGGGEYFEGTDTYGDGSTFVGKYWYDSTGRLYEIGRLTFPNGIYLDILPELPPANPPSVEIKADPNPGFFVGPNISCPETLTATGSGIYNPEYQFLARAGEYPENDNVSGTWTIIRDWNSDASCTWKPPDVGPYTLQVLAREHHADAEAVPVSACTRLIVSLYTIGMNPLNPWDKSVSLTADPLVQQQSLPVQLSASTQNMLFPEYKFLYRPEGGTGSWLLMRDWGTAATFTWKSQEAGSFLVKAMARNKGDTDSEALYAVITVRITGPNQVMYVERSVNLQGEPLEPEQYQPVVLTASSLGIQDPEYKYLYRLDSGAGDWRVLRDWGVASYTWETQEAGSFLVKVMARGKGEAEGDAIYTVITVKVTAKALEYGSIGGKVLSSQTSLPVAGATVAIYYQVLNPANSFSKEVLTDASGQFSFTGLPYGEYDVKAGKEGYNSAEQHVKVNGMEPVNITLYLEPKG